MRQVHDGGYVPPMGRPLRAAEAEIVYHVLNRANTPTTIFDDEDEPEGTEGHPSTSGDSQLSRAQPSGRVSNFGAWLARHR